MEAAPSIFIDSHKIVIVEAVAKAFNDIPVVNYWLAVDKNLRQQLRREQPSMKKGGSFQRANIVSINKWYIVWSDIGNHKGIYCQKR